MSEQVDQVAKDQTDMADSLNAIKEINQHTSTAKAENIINYFVGGLFLVPAVSILWFVLKQIDYVAEFVESREYIEGIVLILASIAAVVLWGVGMDYEKNTRQKEAFNAINDIKVFVISPIQERMKANPELYKDWAVSYLTNLV